MGKGIHGGFRYTVGRGNNMLVDNLADVTRRFPLSTDGLFGKRGKGSRVIETDTPIGTAYEFFNRLVKGYDIIIPIPYKDGSRKGCVARMKDGSAVTLRRRSTSDGSPVVDINIESPGRVKKQKIHFVRKGE